MKQERKIIFIEGPLIEKVKRDAQIHLIKIAKRNIENGSYQPSKVINS